MVVGSADIKLLKDHPRIIFNNFDSISKSNSEGELNLNLFFLENATNFHKQAYSCHFG